MAHFYVGILSLCLFLFTFLCVFFFRKCVHDFILCAVVSLQNTLLSIYIYTYTLTSDWASFRPVLRRPCTRLLLKSSVTKTPFCLNNLEEDACRKMFSLSRLLLKVAIIGLT